VWRIGESGPSQHSPPSSRRGFCVIMFACGKSVAEPASDATQARRAMNHHGSSISVLYPLVALRSCTYVHRNGAGWALLTPRYFIIRARSC
jgi:hypothetical protein